MEEIDMQEWISRYVSSGENNVSAYCRREGINYSQFKYHWARSPLRTEVGSPSGFASIAVQKKVTTMRSTKSHQAGVVARLFSDGQLKLEIQGEFTAGFLRELAGC